MLEQLHTVVVFAALLGSGLIAGVFFAFSAFVMKALVRLSPDEGISAMQSINITVLSPWFLGVFLGTAVMCITLIVWTLFQANQMASGYFIAGSIFYLLGCFLVTVVCNVPRNEALAKVNPSSADSTGIWYNYVNEWTFWNHVRTIASLVAMACFGLALS